MQLTDKERIESIEKDTPEQQTRVAKAFIRDDIDDENVQYLFNTDSLDALLDPETKVENQNAKAPDGIGAGNFTMRTWKPYDNLNFITTGAGGWNTCIKGYPTDPEANVLSNCVGYASGRFNEIINDARGTEGCEYTNLNCNAENFVERAEAAGLETGDEPRLGAIMCWQKGSLSSGDGAGHVAIVEEVYDNNSVYTSESAYGGTAFYNSNRTNDNGRWGIGSAYSFRCFIYLPDDVQNIIGGGGTSVTANVDRDESRNQIEVLISDLRVRTDPNTGAGVIGFASEGFYNYYDAVDTGDYVWYRIDDGQWIASNDGWTNVLPAVQPPAPEPEPPQPQPAPSYNYNVGDLVVISGDLYLNAYANTPAGSVDYKVTTITRREDGAPHPYNTEGDLGWMDESSISPYSEPIETGLEVGDDVRIIGTGNGNSLGTGATAYGIGWERQILKIWDDRPYPYQVGNWAGTTGFYTEDALEKI